MMHPRFTQSMKPSSTGFTLADLLIALGILAVIATFTIPKVLQAEQNQKYNAMAREAANVCSGAYQALIQEKGYNIAYTFWDLIPYMNYVKVETSAAYSADDYGAIPTTCNANRCVVLPNGGVLWAYPTHFPDTSNTSAIRCIFDADGLNVTDQQRAVVFFIYYNGRVTSASGIFQNTCTSNDPAGPICWANPFSDPSWFSWN